MRDAGAGFLNFEDFPRRYDATWIWCDIECTGLDPTSPGFGVLEIAAAVTGDDLTVQDTFHVIIHQPDRVLAGASSWCAEHFGPRYAGGNDLFQQCRASVISEAEAGELLEAFIVKHAKPRKARAAAAAEVPEAVVKRNVFKTAEFGDVIEDGDAMAGDIEAQDTRRHRAGPAYGRPRPRAQQHDVYRVMFAGCSCYFDRGVILNRFPNLRKYIAHKTIDVTSVLEITRRWRPDLLRSLPAPQGTHRALPDVLESICLLRWVMTNLFAAR
ncbi:hypothetical protein JKP88DRAFT_272889 [Tribonema minus]|uniref:Exonuclease domain-containing protein n=1 Tax=Tribonema minus TaxID=303371 RepID=A0A836CDV0_9STRA|nr:hypothetical protein JKP88DRAFT_290690 [Tribonema minus]KAG5182923.1 hypothetical protein JKP88DRAFT_272889 [Tribonema minus]